MAKDPAPPRPGGDAAVYRLCEKIRALSERRVQLDRELAVRPEHDQEREALWIELDNATSTLPCLVARLAALRADTAPGLRAKAAILSLVLRSPAIEAGEFPPEAATLALSLAEEVADFI